MSYPNVCPDCNGHFDPGHTCPPTPTGDRIRDLERQLAEAQEAIEMLGHRVKAGLGYERERDEAQGKLKRLESELPFIEAKLIQWSEDAEEYGSFAWQYRDRVDEALDALDRILSKEGNE